jgi:hypothetical protein
LSADPNGDLPDGTFSYPSVLGMLGYLQANWLPLDFESPSAGDYRPILWLVNYVPTTFACQGF